MQWGTYGWGMGAGWITMVLFWVVVVLGVMFIAQRVRCGRGSAQGETPMDILKKRYAKGELTKEQYEKMKNDLRKD